MLNGKKILISSCGGLGDLLMFTPSLRVLKSKYPDCTITFLTNAHNKDVLTGLAYIDNVITLQRKKAFGRFNAIKHLVGQDYVIFTDWQPQLAVCAYLFRVPHRAGIPKPGHRINRYLNKILTNNVMLSPHYAAETNALIFSEALDVAIEGDMTGCDVSQPRETDIQTVNRLLSDLGLTNEQHYICFAPFTGMEERNWPVEHAKIFVEMVKDKLNIPVILIGPPSKVELANQIETFSLVGTTSVLQMVEIIKRAKLFIGPDSGPMHVAGAVGTPLIALFNKDLPSRWAPRERCRVLTLNLPCSPCDDHCARNCKTLQCMQGITPEMVFTAMEEELEKCNPKGNME